ncbi:MAG: type IV pilus assembly protein PilM [Candidatus Eisenbacteria bacterium]
MRVWQAFLKTDIGTVGIDIGSRSVKAVEASRRAGRLWIGRYGAASLPPDAIVDGEVMDREVVIECIQDLLRESGIRSRHVASAVSGRSVIVKRITLDSMTTEEAGEVIYWEAEQHITYGIDEVSLDYQILGESGQGKMDVLLVAAKKETVEMHMSLLRDAGLVPMIVDVDSLAVQNAFEANYEVDKDEKVLLMNVGASVTNVSLLAGGAPLFTRDLSIAGNAFVEEIQRVLSVDREEAERIARDPIEEERERIAPILETVGQDLLLGVERSLSYLRGVAGSAEISRALLSGGGALLPGLHAFVANRLGVPVEIADPFRSLDYDGDLFGEGEREGIGPSLMVAVGLALR